MLQAQPPCLLFTFLFKSFTLSYRLLKNSQESLAGRTAKEISNNQCSAVLFGHWEKGLKPLLGSNHFGSGFIAVNLFLHQKCKATNLYFQGNPTWKQKYRNRSEQRSSGASCPDHMALQRSTRRLEWLFALSTVKVKTLVTIAAVGFLFRMSCPCDEQELTEMEPPPLQPLHMLGNDRCLHVAQKTDVFREREKESPPHPPRLLKLIHT